MSFTPAGQSAISVITDTHYDLAGNVESVDYANDLTIDYTVNGGIDDLSRPRGYKVTQTTGSGGSSSTSTLQHVHFNGYDSTGHLTGLTDQVNSKVTNFTYDALDRVKTITGDNDIDEDNLTVDDLGRITKRDGRTYTYWGANGGTGKSFKLKSDGIYTYQYDGNGHCTKKSKSGEYWWYKYRADQKLTAIYFNSINDRLNAKKRVEYHYDALGFRVKEEKASSDLYTLWMGQSEPLYSAFRVGGKKPMRSRRITRGGNFHGAAFSPSGNLLSYEDNDGNFHISNSYGQHSQTMGTGQSVNWIGLTSLLIKSAVGIERMDFPAGYRSGSVRTTISTVQARTFSATTDKIVYDVDGDIFIMDIDGGNVAQLTDSANDDTHPIVHGGLVYFQRNYKLFSIDPNNVPLEDTEILVSDAEQIIRPRKGPNGLLAYDTIGGTKILDPDGEKFPTTIGESTRFVYAQGANFSSDGNSIAITARDESEEGTGNIYVSERLFDHEQYVILPGITWVQDSQGIGEHLYTRITDHLGSQLFEMNEDGELVKSRNKYDYLGSLVAGDEHDARFTGHRYDPDINLIVTAYRHFDPAQGRWIQRDYAGFVDGFDRYGYVGGAWGQAVDPLGLKETVITNAQAGRLRDSADELNQRVNSIVKEVLSKLTKSGLPDRTRMLRAQRWVYERLTKGSLAGNDTMIAKAIDGLGAEFVLPGVREGSKYPAGVVYPADGKGNSSLNRLNQILFSSIVKRNKADGQLYWLDKASLASGVNIGGQAIGLDKVDHIFFDAYTLLKHKKAKSSADARLISVDFEKGYSGLKISGIFSNADIEANLIGFDFYKQVGDAARKRSSVFNWDIKNYNLELLNENVNLNSYLKSFYPNLNK